MLSKIYICLIIISSTNSRNRGNNITSISRSVETATAAATAAVAAVAATAAAAAAAAAVLIQLDPPFIAPHITIATTLYFVCTDTSQCTMVEVLPICVHSVHLCVHQHVTIWSGVRMTFSCSLCTLVCAPTRHYLEWCAYGILSCSLINLCMHHRAIVAFFLVFS